jgi:hypothetical protein
MEEIMNTKMSLRILQIVLGAVLFLYSGQLVMGQLHGPHQGHAFFVLTVLGSIEAIAAVVFLFAAPIGGPALLVTFAVAALFHILHGQPWEVGGLLIYAAAALAAMSGRRVEQEAADGR